jgi:hypothetical protein
MTVRSYIQLLTHPMRRLHADEVATDASLARRFVAEAVTGIWERASAHPTGTALRSGYTVT